MNLLFRRDELDIIKLQLLFKLLKILDEINGTNVDIRVIAFSYNIAYNKGSFLANRSFNVLIKVLFFGSGSEESTF